MAKSRPKPLPYRYKQGALVLYLGTQYRVIRRQRSAGCIFHSPWNEYGLRTDDAPARTRYLWVNEADVLSVGEHHA